MELFYIKPTDKNMNLKVHIYSRWDYMQIKIFILKFGKIVVYNKSHQTLGKELSEYKAFKCLDFSRSKAFKLELSI